MAEACDVGWRGPAFKICTRSFVVRRTINEQQRSKKSRRSLGGSEFFRQPEGPGWILATDDHGNIDRRARNVDRRMDIDHRTADFETADCGFRRPQRR